MRIQSLVPAMAVAGVIAGALVGCGNPGEEGRGATPTPSVAAGPSSSASAPPVSMDQMMDRMRTVTGEMSSLMAETPGKPMGGASQGAMTAQAQLGPLTESMNGLADRMTLVMRQMQTVLADQELMQKDGMARGMQRMELNLEAMMDGFANMVDNLQQLQGQPSQPE